MLGLGGLAREEQAPAELLDKARERDAAPGRGTSRGPMRCATRSRRPAGRCATPPAARCCTAAMTAEVVYGTHPVREALRGRREVLRVYCSDRAARGRDWLPAGVEVVPAERLSELAGSEDHQGLVAEVAPYPYADRRCFWSRVGALLVALDEVTDPHNLGAVARVCEGAGADGLLITRRRSAAVTAAVCRASAGAVEHLGRAGREPGGHADPGAAAGAVELRRGCGEATCRTTGTTTATARCSCWERRGGAAAARGTPATRRRRSRCGAGRVAERGHGGGGAAVRGSQAAARWLRRGRRW